MKNNVRKMSMKEFMSSYKEANPKITSKHIQDTISRFKDLMNHFIASSTEGEDLTLTIKDLGTFNVKHRAERQGRNPREPHKVINIPSSRSLTFKSSKSIKKELNKK